MPKRIKILFTLPNFKTAGSGREMFNIIQRLNKDLFEPWIAVQEAGGKLYEEIVKEGYPVLVLRFMAGNVSIKRQFALSLKYARIFRPHGFQIWQSFNWSSDFSEALVARLSGASYVYVKKNMNWDRLAWKIKSVLSNKIVARNTDLLKHQFAAWYFRKKVCFITGAVSPEIFNQAAKSDIRQRYSIPTSAFLVICVAQLVKVKDHPTLINAIGKMTGAWLLLAGSGKDETYLNQLKQLTERLGVSDRVVFAGAVTDVNDILKSSDVFVLPTGKLYGHEEGCPVALMEAMAAGTPAIASAVAGSRDLIVNHKTGLLFEPGDIDGLVAALAKYKADPEYAQKMARNAQEVIRTGHTLDQEAAAFSNMYQKMAGKSK